MSTPIRRRTLLAAGPVPPPVCRCPASPPAGGRPKTRFTLNAETLDGGEQVISVTLHTAGLGPIVPASLTDGTFTVHAKATSPIPLAAGDRSSASTTSTAP